MDHQHDHHHHHQTPGPVSPEQQATMLAYMLDHNRHHAQDLHALAHQFADAGKHEAAAMLDQALAAYQQGNDLLAQALANLKGEG